MNHPAAMPILVAVCLVVALLVLALCRPASGEVLRTEHAAIAALLMAPDWIA